MWPFKTKEEKMVGLLKRRISVLKEDNNRLRHSLLILAARKACKRCGK